jgi:hypothetical protein
MPAFSGIWPEKAGPPGIFAIPSGATSQMGVPDFCLDFSWEKAGGWLFLAPGRL